MKQLVRNFPRPRLRDALLRADCRVRLLCAPAGSGKSVLLGECLELAPPGTSVVRLDLFGRRLDVGTFEQALADALGVSFGGAELTQYLSSSTQPLWIALDDYPRYPTAWLDERLNEMIMRSSSVVRWWIGSRRRPLLQLTRLLLEGELFELEGRDLAFNEGELSNFLQQQKLSWSRTQVLRLLEQTGGWCAGVRLMIPDPSLVAAHRRNINELLLDYLRREVLDDLDEGWRLALFGLAQFPSFDADLCEHLLGVGEGAELFENLRQCGLFIEPAEQGGSNYRVMPVLAPLLAGLMAASEVRALFRTACSWYLGRKEIRPAVECALRAGQVEMAASLMQRYTEDRLLHGRGIALLLEWRRELPEEMLISTPRLAMLNAWASLLSGRLAEGQYYIAALERFLPQPVATRQWELLAQCEALAAKLAFHQGRGEEVGVLLSLAVSELPQRAWSQRLLCRLMQVEQALIDGEFEQAQQLNRESMQEARELGSLAFEVLLALEHVKLLEMRGELLRAESLLYRLHQEVSRSCGDEPSPLRGRVELHLASIMLHLGRYQEAEVRFAAGVNECHACADPAAIWGQLGLAELEGLAGNYAAAFDRLAEAERSMQLARIDPHLYQSLLLVARARVWLAQGRYSQVEHALGEHLKAAPTLLPPFGTPDLNLRLRVLLAQARIYGSDRVFALETLADHHRQAQGSGRQLLACELGVSLAEGWYVDGRHRQAKQMLLDVLTLSRQLGLVSVERSLAQRAPVLACWACESLGGAPVDLLSQRELDVLKCIAQGMSNQQVAQELHISTHTVKTHAQRINFKLGVERRTQAVARAKELGLLA